MISVVPNPEVKNLLEANYADLVKLRAHDLPRVALHIEARPGGRNQLLTLLADILPDKEREPSPLLTTLAQLPFRLIVTTNYDRLMERAFKQETNIEPIVVVQPTRGFKPKKQREWEQKLAQLVPATPSARGNDEPLILYKIHGTFGDDEAGLVISEEDYIGFPTVAGTDSRRGMPPLIRQMVVDGNLLFLGYSLEDWNFRAIYKGLIEPLPDSKKRMSFAIQRRPSEFWANFWAKPPKNVTIYDKDLYTFADELRQEDGRVRWATARRRISSSMPTNWKTRTCSSGVTSRQTGPAGRHPHDAPRRTLCEDRDRQDLADQCGRTPGSARAGVHDFLRPGPGGSDPIGAPRDRASLRAPASHWASLRAAARRPRQGPARRALFRSVRGVLPVPGTGEPVESARVRPRILDSSFTASSPVITNARTSMSSSRCARSSLRRWRSSATTFRRSSAPTQTCVSDGSARVRRRRRSRDRQPPHRSVHTSSHSSSGGSSMS